jgi:hypothetical protein
MKHALRSSERMIFSGQRLTATKIVFPFSKNDLGMGGESLFVGEPEFARRLAAKLNVADPYEIQADLDVLEILDGLPSFDPFLLRERLRQVGKEPARCYFDVSAADTLRMQKFVTGEIAALVELAFAGKKGAAREHAAKLAEKLMTDETAESLTPLRKTLQLSGQEYSEGVFAWKGFLYYKWIVAERKERLPELVRSIMSARIFNAPRGEQEALNISKQRVVQIMNDTMRKVGVALGGYDLAFNGLAQGKASGFRDFLLEAPAMFLGLGEAVGVVQHIDSFWRFRFPAGRTPMMEGQEATDIFEEFELTLSGIAANAAADARRHG